MRRPRKGGSAHGAKKARLANERWDELGRRAREVRREGKGRNASNLDADQKVARILILHYAMESTDRRNDIIRIC